MKKTNSIFALALLLLLGLRSTAQDHLCRVKIHPANAQQRDQVMGMLEIDHLVSNVDKSIEVEILKSQLAALKFSNIRYDVLIADIPRWLDSVNQPYMTALKQGNTGLRVAMERSGSVIDNLIARPAAFDVKPTMAGYYSFPEMEAAMDALVAQYPSIAKKTSIGKSYENRDLWVIKISDNVNTDENEPEAFFMGLQHPREAVTGASMIFFMQYLCEQYATNNSIKELVNNREIFIMPCFNPDGYEYNRAQNPNGGGSWRKNRNPTGSGNYGVDLNRNWGVDWGNCSAPIQGSASSCGSSTKSSDTYYGTAAFSENETQALRAFAKTRNFKTAFDQHAFGPYYSLPFGRQSLHNSPSTDMSPKDSNFYKVIPALMGTFNGMRAADSYDALGYEVAGGFKDWMLTGEIGVGTKDTVWGMTGEGGAGGGTPAFGGMQNFWAPAAQIVALCKGMCYQNIQLALAAGTMVDLQDLGSMTLNATSGDLSFQVRRIGIGNNAVTVTALPLENIKITGSPVTIGGLAYYHTYTGNIAFSLPAAVSNGQRIRFVWKVEAGGITFYDTITKIYNPTEAFADDMEGTFSDNWSDVSVGGASGFGYNYTAGSFGFTTGGFNSGKALSESAAGANYTNTTRSIVQCKTSFNLTGTTAAYISFWVKHRAENFRDKLQLQVSSTQDATWRAVEGKYTIKEPGTLDGSSLNGEPALTGVREIWTREEFDLSAYLGHTNVRFRFVFTSDQSHTFKFSIDDGFYIDDVQVLQTSAPLVNLPVKIESFTAELENERQVKLKWKAELNDLHDYFIVERSADGEAFKNIGKISRGQAHQLVDKKPGAVNFYRLRQVDKDEKKYYSTVVRVSLKQQIEAVLFPNPAQDVMQLQIKSANPGRHNIQLVDVTGQKVVDQYFNISSQGNLLVIPVSQLGAQVYMLQVVNEKNEIVFRQKVVKQ